MVIASAREAKHHGKPADQENVSSRSAPPSGIMEASNSRTSNSSSRHLEQVKTKTERKRENTKLDRKDMVPAQKPVRSTTNLNGNALQDAVALNGKLVDAYHIRDATQNLQEGFRGGKLQHETESGSLKGGKVGKTENSNGKLELHYSSATDLSQPPWYQLNGAGNNYKTNGGRKMGVGSVPPRSASSSSSRDENEPRSESTNLDRSEVCVVA